VPCSRGSQSKARTWNGCRSNRVAQSARPIPGKRKGRHLRRSNLPCSVLRCKSTNGLIRLLDNIASRQPQNTLQILIVIG
jgi:hypothetical protein